MDPITYADQVMIKRNLHSGFRTEEIWLDKLVSGILNDANGNNTVISDQTINLADLPAAAYQNLLTVPAYSCIDFIGLIVGTTVTKTGNAALLGLGLNSGTPNLYGGSTASLLAGQHVQCSGPGYSASAVVIDLCGISSGVTLTTGTLTGGIIRFVCKYRTPNVLAYPAPAGDPAESVTV